VWEIDQKRNINLFFAYAQKDERFASELEKHLFALRHQRMISMWSARQVVAGSVREEAVQQYLLAADIILVLLSADFLASDYAYSQEMMQALRRHHIGEAIVIPIILRSCSWENTPFAKLQALPPGALPIALWADRDAAFYSIVQAIESVYDQIQWQPGGSSPDGNATRSAGF
jgi:hypothetical protein